MSVLQTIENSIETNLQKQDFFRTLISKHTTYINEEINNMGMFELQVICQDIDSFLRD